MVTLTWTYMFDGYINKQLQFNNQLKIKKKCSVFAMAKMQFTFPSTGLCFHNAIVLIILNFEQNVIIT